MLEKFAISWQRKQLVHIHIHTHTQTHITNIDTHVQMHVCVCVCVLCGHVLTSGRAFSQTRGGFNPWWFMNCYVTSCCSLIAFHLRKRSRSAALLQNLYFNKGWNSFIFNIFSYWNILINVLICSWSKPNWIYKLNQLKVQSCQFRNYRKLCCLIYILKIPYSKYRSCWWIYKKNKYIRKPSR